MISQPTCLVTTSSPIPPKSTVRSLSLVLRATTTLSRFKLHQSHKLGNTQDGDDSIFTKWKDQIFAANGDNTVDAAEGNDTVVTGAGADSIQTEAGDDFVLSGEGDDVINSDEGNDFVNAEGGNNTVIAGIGNDIVQ